MMQRTRCRKFNELLLIKVWVSIKYDGDAAYVGNLVQGKGWDWKLVGAVVYMVI
jgi:hypothetical protein